ncbi:MAG: VacJ family lipoprotein [Sulfuricellaceae bacterium]|nr:VacJ family lipoprotein [Sulfuricellaceae bacterium]
MTHPFTGKLFALAFCAGLLSGCATNGDPRDPLEPLNRGIYQFNQSVDKTVLKPVATGYQEVLPQPVRTAVGNFFSNLDDVSVLLNDLLQFKLQRAISDFSRVVWNSTAGLIGLIDVATPMGLEKHNEDFGQTLGYWGVGDGPFLVLPLLGSSDLRDTAALFVDSKADIVYQQSNMAARNSEVTLRAVQERSVLLGAERTLEEAALDPYAFRRDGYLQKRRSLIYDGNPPREKEDWMDEPSAPEAPSKTAPAQGK